MATNSLTRGNLREQQQLNMNQTKKDPFKATKIWNEVLQAFYFGIELKKHRRNMKTYYDCFTASEAVTWLKNYLKQCEHFTVNKVTRFQALNLLRKYHRSNIIERIKVEKNDKEFQDNNELFRFTINANENLPFLSTTKSEADLLESCSDEQISNKNVELNLSEKVDIYKKIAWKQMIKILPKLNDFVKLEKLDSQSLYNNATRVNSNGVVQLSDKNDDLPQWILSAMKCLANWPKASGSGNCLPKYPGFEFDVFNLIREYFTNMEEPIIPFCYYQLLVLAFDNYLEVIALNRKKFSTLSKYNSSFLLNSKSVKQVKNEINLPSNCVYETVFSGTEPVTKIVPIDELSEIFPNLMNYFNQNSKEKSITENSFNSSSFTPNSTSRELFKTVSTIPRNSKLNRIENSTPKNLNKSEINFSLESPPEAGEYMMDKNFGLKRFYSLRKSSKQLSNLSIQEEDPTPNNNKNQFYELIKLILLVLPSSNRRQLHLLIRMFYKIIRNKELCLLTKDSFALKEYIVNIFTRTILRSQLEAEFNEFKAKEFVSFLIDQCMDIFQVPQEFTKEVDRMMNELKNKKMETKENFYCQKISNEEFEIQRDVMSEMALSELLESIMRDDSLTERDKLKWIKQFKMYHPEVYDIYFTNCTAKLTTNTEEHDRKNQPNGSTATAINHERRRRTRSLGSAFITNRDLVKRFLSLRF